MKALLVVLVLAFVLVLPSSAPARPFASVAVTDAGERAIPVTIPASGAWVLTVTSFGGRNAVGAGLGGLWSQDYGWVMLQGAGVPRTQSRMRTVPAGDYVLSIRCSLGGAQATLTRFKSPRVTLTRPPTRY